MTWPWIGRAAHEIAMSSLEGAVHANRALAEARLESIEQLNEEVTYLRRLVETQHEAVLTLRREGFEPPVAPPTVEREEEPDMDPAIMRMIEGYVDPDSRDYALMVEDARQQLAAGMSKDEVLEGVQRGSRLNPHRL